MQKLSLGSSHGWGIYIYREKEQPPVGCWSISKGKITLTATQHGKEENLFPVGLEGRSFSDAKAAYEAMEVEA